MLQPKNQAHPHRNSWSSSLAKPLLHQGKKITNQIKTSFWERVKGYKDKGLEWASNNVPKIAQSFAEKWVGKQLAKGVGSIVGKGISALDKKILNPYLQSKVSEAPSSETSAPVFKTKRISKQTNQIKRLQALLQQAKRRQSQDMAVIKQRRQRQQSPLQGQVTYNLQQLYDDYGGPRNTVPYDPKSFSNT